MNLANKITLFRIVLVPLFIYLVYMDNMYLKGAAVIIFIVASLTDTLDGYVARRYNMITDFGKFVDPLADKLLVTAALVILVDFGRMPAWICIAILAREFMVTALRTVAMSEGKVIAASKWGKLKTVIQMVGLTILLARLPRFVVGPVSVDLLINWSMFFITMWSGYDYLKKNWDLVKQAK